MALVLLGGNVSADNKEELLPALKKITADDKARFGNDVKKCRLECQRVYSESHCRDKCAEIASNLRAKGFTREAEEKWRIEEEKPVKYKEAAEKYR